MSNHPAPKAADQTPGGRRTLLCVGGENDAWMAGFRQHAETLGYKAVCYPLSSSLTGSISRNPYGVIVFDTGEDKTPARLKRLRECTRYLEVPIVAITPPENRADQSRLLAAGAHAQLPIGTPYATVLHEIETRADMEPVFSEMHTHVLKTFIGVTEMTFREMAQVDIHIRASYQKRAYTIFGDISAVLGLFGQSEGALAVSFPHATALRLTKCIFPELNVEEDQEMVRDCVGEIANIIGGQAKGQLSTTDCRFNISTPTIITGLEHQVRHKAGVPSLIAVFDSSLGDFALQVCMSV